MSAVFGRGFRSSRIDRDEQDARAAAGLGRRRHEPRVGQYGWAQTEHGQRLSSAEASDVLSSSLLHVAEGVGERQLTPHTQMSSPCGARAGRAKSVTASPHTAQRRGCADTVQATALKVESTGCSAYVDLTSGAAPSGAGGDGARLGSARRERARAEGVRNTKAAHRGAPMSRQRPPRARRIWRRLVEARRYGVGRRSRFVDTSLQRLQR